MTKDKLIRVDRFEELKTGMRILVKRCLRCGRNHAHILGGREKDKEGRDGFVAIPSCTSGVRVKTTTLTIDEGRVFRFASDIDGDAELASEENPYLVPVDRRIKERAQ